MKRLLELQDECMYIFDSYNRYKGDTVDMTTSQTCFDILHWMSERKEFDNVIYAAGVKCDGERYKEIIGEKEKEELIESLFKDKMIRHKKKTIGRCLELLLQDMYVDEEKVEKL